MKVLLGMSGGVDSAVSAYLLKKQGYEVYGGTMLLWQGDNNDNGCGSKEAINDAKKICDFLDIPHYVFDFREEFKLKVIDYFVDEYCKGRTPNPCIACNRYMKFDMLLNKAIHMGFDYISTGHYAICEKMGDKYYIKKSKADKKDQTYVLYNLNQEQLAHVLFPLGNFKDKQEIRDIAKEIGLSVADKPDSQEICFINDDDYANFIEKYKKIKFKPGNFVDVKGNILGKHNGIINYTIGQRRWLGIALGQRTFVVDIDIEKNQVVLGENEDLFKNKLIASDVNFISIILKDGEKREVTAKIRYAAKPAKCCITRLPDGKVLVEFEENQRAFTKGQAIVFYDEDILLGGGIIYGLGSL